MINPRVLLRKAFDAAVSAAQPDALIPYLQQLPEISGRTAVLLVGKAASAQAPIVEAWLPDAEGLCIIPHGHQLATGWTVIEAAHPVPDAGSLQAAHAALSLAASLGSDDRLLCVISGGGSALMSAPLPGMPVELKMDVHRALLASGASISELNTVRKQLSLVKGGRLARATQAQVVNWLVSDVPGDRVEFIASGPTVPAYTTQADAIEVLTRYAIPQLDALLPWLKDPTCATPSPVDPCFDRVTTSIVAAPQKSLTAARAVLEQAGCRCWVLGDSIEGDSETVARVMAETALWAARHESLTEPLCLLSGGETTVKVTGQGIGGPNAHFALTLVDALHETPEISAIVCDTDGVDGAAPIAGAFVDAETLSRARTLGLSLHEALKDQDAHGFFRRLEQSVVTGPTGTNVNDFRAILIMPNALTRESPVKSSGSH